MTAFDSIFSNQMRRNRDVLFFALNAFGWISWGLAQYVGFVLYRKEDYPFITLAAVAVTTGFLLTTLLRYICRVLWRQRPLLMIVGGVASGYALALVMRLIVNSMDRHLMQSISDAHSEMHHWYEIFAGVIWSTYLMLAWMGLYFGFRFYEAAQQERERSLRADALAQAAQLKMLRYQLNPHFLFNTLNAVSTLILDQRNAVANTVVTRLAEFLRYTLDQDPMKTVSLTQEIAALNLYLEIEKLRFGSRLTVEQAIEPQAEAARIPSLLLQPLIENSIKYAISVNETGGRIAIRARLDGDMLIVSVADDGPGLVDTSRLDSGRGVGLRNIRERLLAMYGTRAHMDSVNTQPGLCITLVFPARLYEAIAQ